MKNLILTIFAFISLLSSCSSQTYLEKGLLTTIVNQEQFTFMAETVSITNQDVINTMNALPGANPARMQDLDYGNGIIFENKEMKVFLPYFGRTYNPSRDLDKAGFQFTSKDYSIEKSEGKKGKTILTIKPKDIKNINNIFMEITPNGKCYVSISANDRQPISFIGYIMKNEVKKEKSKSIE